ncbi:MAG: hypothetical protein P8H17_06075 [Flavobacteriales bacterium]|nr:hypothetical protein [Flavobacteriales bacterium]|tara:strand:+ start:563 stop:1009 length:447 start_codon:yes stop_codon:yes gene_type:complete
MKKNLLRLSLFLFSILFTNSLVSQSNNWELYYYDDDKIKIEYNYMICDFSSTASKEMIIFRFTNLSEEKIKLYYETEIWNDSIKINTEQNADEFRKTINLNSNQIITANCENQWKEHVIFSAFVHNETSEKYVSLTKFELTNITISDD